DVREVRGAPRSYISRRPAPDRCALLRELRFTQAGSRNERRGMRSQTGWSARRCGHIARAVVLYLLVPAAALPVVVRSADAQTAGAQNSNVQASAAGVESLRTAPERTNYRETTRYAEIAEWMERVAAASPVIHLDTLG